MRLAMSIVFAASASIAGCGRVGFAVRGGAGDDTTGSDSGTTADTTMPTPNDAIVPASACAGTVHFTDTFDTGSPGPTFTTFTGTGLTVDESGGELVITFAAFVGSGSYTGYTTTATYPVEGLCGVAQIVQLPSSGADMFVKAIDPSSGQQIETIEIDDTLDFRVHGNFTDASIGIVDSVALDLATMSYWRLRIAGGVAYWDTSGDGVTYVQRASLAGFVTVPQLELSLGAGAQTDVNDSNAAAFAATSLSDP